MGSLVINKKEAHHYYGGTVEYWHGVYTDETGEEEYIASTQQAILDYFSKRMIEHRKQLAREMMH